MGFVYQQSTGLGIDGIGHIRPLTHLSSAQKDKIRLSGGLSGLRYDPLGSASTPRVGQTDV